MMTDKEFCDEVHMNIHALRRVSGYKATPSDIKISKLVIEKYADTCKECREAGEKNKNAPQKQGFFDKLNGVLDDS